MKVSFEIFNQGDAAEAVGMLLAIEDAFRSIDSDLVAERPTTETVEPPTTMSAAPAPEPATTEQPATPKRGRKPRSTKGPLTTADKITLLTLSASDPEASVETIVQKFLNGTAPAPNDHAGGQPVLSSDTVEAYAAGLDALNGHNPEQPDLFQDENIEAARDRLRTVAQEKGVAWLRPQLEARGAKRMSDLSDSQVREFLRDHA